jgi:hypothetical protein
MELSWVGHVISPSDITPQLAKSGSRGGVQSSENPQGLAADTPRRGQCQEST